MRVLVLGGSGAAHALTWKLFESNRIQQLAAMPGNAGIGLIAPIASEQHTLQELASWAADEAFNMVVPSDGTMLGAGLTDEATGQGVAVSGPPQRSAFFEVSRLWTREFINRHQLLATPGRAFTDRQLAERYLAAQTLPVNLYADIPSEFDGAYTDRGQAMTAIAEMFSLPPQPNALRGVVIETPAVGPTVALSCFTDGKEWQRLLPVRMYDRLEDGDRGWAAAGMGAHTSDQGLLTRVGDIIEVRILEPLINAIQREQLPWWGVLGVDCAITADGPKLLRIRTTLSDPEAQVILPRLDEDLVTIFAACHNQAMDQLAVFRWKHQASVGVTLVQNGYPHQSAISTPLSGLEQLHDVLIFHHHTNGPNSMEYVSYQFDETEAKRMASRIKLGTSVIDFGFGDATDTGAMGLRPQPGSIVGTQARLITVVGLGDSLQAAREKVYQNLQNIQTRFGYHRTDIGLREI